MSEDEQVVAIGRAIQAAAASRKKMHALAAELEHASESFEIAHKALREVLLGTKTLRAHDIHRALKAVPDVQRVKELVADFEETVSKHLELEERAKQLSDL